MNTITKEIILERLNRFKNRVDELGGTTSKIVCKEVATEEEILNLEKELGYKLPDDFRWVLLNVSSHLEFFWNLYREEEELLELPNELVEIFSGNLYFGIDTILSCEESRKGWIDICYPDYNNPYDKIFHNKLAFQKVSNGEFLEEYTKIGCVGGEDWQWEAFTNNRATPIDASCENAKNWLEIMFKCN